MKKHLFLYLISLSLILCFAACSNSKNDETKEQKPLTENNASNAAKPKTSTTTRPQTNTTTKATTSSTMPSSSATKPKPEQPVTKNIDLQVIDRTDSRVKKALTAYRDALLDKAELFYVPYNSPGVHKTFFNQMLDIGQGVKEFAIIDLDHDGLPEVVLPYPSYSSQLDGYYILHYDEKENRIYAYDPSNRQFGEPKIDGTFHAASSGFESATCRIASFDGVETYSTEDIFTTYISQSSDGKDVYRINSKSVTEEEFRAAWAKQDNKLGVTWYDFTEENIEAYFSPQ